MKIFLISLLLCFGYSWGKSSDTEKHLSRHSIRENESESDNILIRLDEAPENLPVPLPAAVPETLQDRLQKYRFDVRLALTVFRALPCFLMAILLYDVFRAVFVLDIELGVQDALAFSVAVLGIVAFKGFVVVLFWLL